MFISDPGSGSFPSRIQRSKSIPVSEFLDPVFAKTSPRRSFSVIENEGFGLLSGKKIWAYFQNYRTFYSKNCHYPLKNMGLGSGIRDPASGKNLFRIPGSKSHRIPDPGSGSATLPITNPVFKEMLRWCIMASILQYT
jgi:hypothetical protein